MAVPSEEEDTLIEEREAQMASLSNGKPTFKIAHFLKPTEQAQTLINPLPPFIFPTKPISPILKSLTKIHFHGWRNPQRKWSTWVEKLTPLFQSTWKKACIFEAIMGSTYKIPKYKESIFSLAEKWCIETNTFVLPWGEITITLEDMMVLGGYSVTGCSVFSEFSSKELNEIEAKLIMARLEISRSSDKRASQSRWIDNWMGNGSEFEHEAFLSLWLSRFVLPAYSLATINKNVFRIAILLARGNVIALAPAVLASVYRDLRLLKEKISDLRQCSEQNDANVTKLYVWAPFQLVQVWLWERFPSLRPKCNSVTHGLCRFEKWHKVKVLRIDGVGLVVDSASDDFQWRPYSTPLNNWSFDFDLESYGRCIRVSQLVGLNCIEPYFPHRVAMQFGLDQDIPAVLPRLSDTRENAWSNYNRSIGDSKLYVSPKIVESGVTTRYLEWWKRSKIVKESAGYVRRNNQKMSVPMEEELRVMIENNEAEFPPGFCPKGKREAAEVDDCSDEPQPSSKRCKQSPDSVVIKTERS